MKFLKTLADQNLQSSTLKQQLHIHLAGFEKPRSLQITHASELTKQDREFCPREIALILKHKIKRPPEFVCASMRSTWNIGRAVESMIIHWMADMGVAVSDWRCRNCNHLHSFTKRPVACGSCGHKNFDPEEPRWKSAVSDASCGTDVLYDDGSGKLCIIEIKSMLDEKWIKLDGPIGEHRARTNLYMRLNCGS